VPTSLVVALAVTLSITGCLGGPDAPRDIPVSPVTSTIQPGADSTSPVAASVDASAATTAKPSGVSAKSLAHAHSIGGSDQEGKTFNFIVGGTFGTEAQAQAALGKALPAFGDTQPYFIVQRSDSLAGMAPGTWVVVEAHFKTPTAKDLELARRGFPGANVVRARVLVSDPIPVYENLVGGD
jgi:hypothetical protein